MYAMHFYAVAFIVISNANKNYFPIKVARLAAAAAAVAAATAALLQRPTTTAGKHTKWACHTGRDLHLTLKFVVVFHFFFLYYFVPFLHNFTPGPTHQPEHLQENKQAKNAQLTT